jgi:hypothetical protein
MARRTNLERVLASEDWFTNLVHRITGSGVDAVIIGIIAQIMQPTALSAGDLLLHYEIEIAEEE